MVQDADAAGVGLIRIEATNLQDALRQIGDRFGKDVNIVSTRKIRRRGVLGMLGATGVEVYVTRKAHHQAFLDHRSGKSRKPTAPERPDRGTRAQQQLAAELMELRAQVKQLVRARGGNGENAGSGGGGPLAGKPHPVLREAQRILEEAGVSASLIKEVLERVEGRKFPVTNASPEEARTLARLVVGELLRPRIPPCMPVTLRGSAGVHPLLTGSHGPRAVALVGPTGVGKTTTIAKLASYFHLTERKRVGLVTLDTYRIGAIDQLRKFSEILNVPLKVVEQGNDVQDTIDQMRDRDIVFIDTAGRSQKAAQRLAESRDMLAGVSSLEIHLCVSLAAARENILDVVKQFRVIPYNRLLLTKLDESPRQGVLLDLFQAARIPVSYITFGQEVPNDIHPASVERLQALLLGEG